MTDVPDLDRFHRESFEEGRQQIITNRWESFTDDELKELLVVYADVIRTTGWGNTALRAEIEAEIARRTEPDQGSVT